MQVFSKFKLEKLKLTHFKIDFGIIMNLYVYGQTYCKKSNFKVFK